MEGAREARLLLRESQVSRHISGVKGDLKNRGKRAEYRTIRT